MTDIYSLIPDFKKTIPKFLEKGNVFAVYGVDSDPNSLSYQAYVTLKKEGLKLYALGPEDKVAGDKMYPGIKSLPQAPTVACIVAQPDKTLAAVKDAHKNGIKMIWIDMGSETQEAIDYCKENNINTVYQHSLVNEIVSPTQKRLKELGKEIS